MLLEGPSSSDYIKTSSQIWFSYLPSFKTFNIGFLGVNEASIAGLLHLRSTEEEPLIINKIKINLIGEETKGWEEPNSNYHEHFEEICNINLDLWESHEEEGFEVTKWDLPFKIPLPNNLPPSMIYLGKDNKFFVRYQLSAIIYRKFEELEIIKKKIISVKLDLIKYHLEPVINHPISLCGNNSRYFEYDIHLNKTTYNLGETIKISMKLFLLNHRVKFKEIDICLKEYIIYESPTHNKFKSHCIISKAINGDIVSNRDEWSADILLSLPPPRSRNKNLLCDITREKVAKIQHKIKIKFIMNKNLFGTDQINIDKQIYIKNFVTEEMHVDLALALSEEVNSFLFNQNRSRMFNGQSNPPPPSYNTPSLPLTPENLAVITSFPPLSTSRPPSYEPPQDNNNNLNRSSPSPSYVSTLGTIRIGSSEYNSSDYETDYSDDYE